MKKVSSFFFALLGSIERALRRLSISERIVVSIIGFIMITSGFFAAWYATSSFLVEVPRHGGVVNEGLIGSPRFINPLLAVSDTDRDLSALIYSGLMRVGPNGALIPDLAENYTVSDTGTVYTFTIKQNARFHDGTPVTADDIIFTIQKAQDPVLKSPKRANWEGVIAQKVDDHTVTFTLKKAYSPFIENTTLGILPKHIWKDALPEEYVFSQFNIEPIGSGPYKIDHIDRNASGVPQLYTLSSFSNFVLGEPYIDQLVFHFFSNEKNLVDAYTKGTIESLSSISATRAAELEKNTELSGDTLRIERFPLPRVLGVFFNQNQNKALAQKEVRTALAVAIDKQNVIDQALSGYGTVLNSPIPPGLVPFETISEKVVIATSSLATTSTSTITQSSDTDARIVAAQNILIKAGWKKNAKGIFELVVPAQKSKKATTIPLAFSLSTTDTPEFKEATELIADQWKKIGADVDVKIFDSSDINQSVLRRRSYDALFFGEVIGRDLDFFGFWHSSQRNDPGLNIALYTNSKVDKLLEDARTLQNRSDRLEKYKAFETEVSNDVPAIFVYAPDFIYILPKDLKNVTLYQMITPSDRFTSVNQWYRETDSVWPILKNI